MNRSILVALSMGSLFVAACGGQGDDKLGDQAEDAAENQADALDRSADNLSGTAEEATEAAADATRAAGEAREEAIDDADVDADSMSNEQKGQLINGQ